MAKLEASDTVVLGISIDSPAANAAFAKQIGVTFPLLSDMNKEVLTSYQILKPYDVKGGKYQWAQRTTIVVDKQGKIQHVEQGDSAVDPNSAVSVCTGLHKPKAVRRSAEQNEKGGFETRLFYSDHAKPLARSVGAHVHQAHAVREEHDQHHADAEDHGGDRESGTGRAARSAGA